MYPGGELHIPGLEQMAGVCVLVAAFLAVGYLLVKASGKELPASPASLASGRHRHVCLLVLLDHGSTYAAKFAKLVHQATLTTPSGRIAALTYLESSINVDDILDTSVLYGDPVEDDGAAVMGAKGLEEGLADLFGKARGSSTSGELTCVLGLVASFPGQQGENMPNTAYATLDMLKGLAERPSTAIGICFTPEPGQRLYAGDGSALFEKAKSLARA